MKLHEFKELIYSVEYKPRYAIECEMVEISNLRIMVHFFEVPDSKNPNKIINVTHSTYLTWRELERMDEKAAIRFIFDRIIDAERHEAMEFFKVDGRQIFDPHENDMTMERKESLNEKFY